MKKKIKRMAASALCLLNTFALQTMVFADGKGDITEVTNGIDVLKKLVLSAVGGVGVIYLAWGLLDFGTAYSAHDTTQQTQAIKKVIGGIIIVAIPTIIGMLT